MERVRLGSLDTLVSRIGFGTWGLGGDSYGRVSEKEALAALGCAYDQGINFYDTANIYGNGRSEKIVGKAFRAVRSKVLIATKGGFLPGAKEQDFSARHIRASLEDSLGRLQTDYVDVYQLHNPTLDAIKNEELWETLEKLKNSGKIRAIGLSPRSPKDGVTTIQQFNVSCLQINFNVIDQRALDCGLLDLTCRRKIGVVARTPLCFGFLTGKITENTIFDERDHRKQWPVEQIRRWASAPRLLNPLCEGKDRSLVGIALQYCLAFPGISALVAGMMSRKEVIENIAALNTSEKLVKKDLDFIRKIYLEHFSKPINSRRK